MTATPVLLDELADLEAMVACLARLQATFDEMTHRQCTTTLRVLQEAAAVDSLVDGRSDRLHLKREVEKMEALRGALRSTAQQLSALQGRLHGPSGRTPSARKLTEEVYAALVHVAATGVVATAQTDVALRDLDLSVVLSVAAHWTEDDHARSR